MPDNPTQKLPMHLGARARLFRFAYRNRRPMTPEEAILWNALSNKHLDGWKFRRQHPCGPYILDFYCHAAKLCVEADGGYHLLPEQQVADKARTAFLEEHGIRVVRFANDEIREDLAGVLRRIREALPADCAPPAPTPNSPQKFPPNPLPLPSSTTSLP